MHYVTGMIGAARLARNSPAPLAVAKSFKLASLLSVLCCFAVDVAGGTWQLPDPATGEITGHPAIVFWPIAPGTDELMDPTGCEVHAVTDGSTRELLFPCAEWFLPPEGRYLAWLESDRWISSFPIVFAYGGGPFQGQGMRVTAPVVPVGRVAVVFTGHAPSSATVRVLSLDGPSHPLDRRASLDAARRGIRMPARRALVGIFVNDEAIALSRPFGVPALGNITTTLSTPAASTVLAVLARPRGADRSRVAASPLLRIASGERPPDVLFDAPTRIYAAWYDLAPAAATLTIHSTGLRLDPVALNLTAGKIATVRKDMDLIIVPSATPAPVPPKQ